MGYSVSVWWLVLVALCLSLLAAAMRLIANRRLAGLDLSGDVVYSDASEFCEILVSDRHGLTGRPDYILKVDDELIPVERKTRARMGRSPQDGEILQLAAYCLLVEERFAKAVSRGQLQYADGSLDIPFDDALRTQLQLALVALRGAQGLSDVSRSHNSAARCRACGVRMTCGQALPS